MGTYHSKYVCIFFNITFSILIFLIFALTLQALFTVTKTKYLLCYGKLNSLESRNLFYRHFIYSSNIHLICK